MAGEFGMAGDPYGPAAGAGGGGFSDLFQNKMLMQFLAAGGQDMMQGTGETNLGAAIQGNIQSQNMMKLLKTLLGPDGTKGTLSSSGLNLTIPKESAMFSSIIGSNEDPFGAVTMSQGGAAKAPQNTGVKGGGSTGSLPFVPTQPTSSDLGEMNPSDLAGLTTQDISAALGMKMERDKIKQQSYRDLVDSIYKGETLRLSRDTHATDKKYKEALTDKALQETEADKPIYEIPDTKIKLNAKEYLAYRKLTDDDKPAAIKNYEYAKNQGFIGSFVDFENKAKTTHKKDYDEAVSGGYKGSFNNWMLEMAKAGAINLGDKVAEKKTMSELAGQLYFNDPKWTADVDKQIAAFDKDQAWLVPEKDRPLARAKVKVKAIEDKIVAGSGAIQSVVMDADDKTMIWTVKWPSGDIKTIKQAVR